MHFHGETNEPDDLFHDALSWKFQGLSMEFLIFLQNLLHLRNYRIKASAPSQQSGFIYV